MGYVSTASSYKPGGVRPLQVIRTREPPCVYVSPFSSDVLGPPDSLSQVTVETADRLLDSEVKPSVSVGPGTRDPICKPDYSLTTSQ